MSSLCFSQIEKQKFNTDSVTVSSRIEFSTYSGQFGTEILTDKPILKFIVTVKNNGTSLIPDLAVSNRSLYLNLYVDGKIENPLSMYNGIDATGNHMLGKGQSDSYTWWVFREDAYADAFTVKWEYCGEFSEEIKLDLKK